MSQLVGATRCGASPPCGEAADAPSTTRRQRSSRAADLRGTRRFGVAAPAYRPAAAGGTSVQRIDRATTCVSPIPMRMRRGGAAGACGASVRSTASKIAADGLDDRTCRRAACASSARRASAWSASRRVALADPAVIVLDEATSSLDPATEGSSGASAGRGSGRPDGGHDRPPPVDGRASRPSSGDGARAVSSRSRPTTSSCEQGDRYARLWAVVASRPRSACVNTPNGYRPAARREVVVTVVTLGALQGRLAA